MRGWKNHIYTHETHMTKGTKSVLGSSESVKTILIQHCWWMCSATANHSLSDYLSVCCLRSVYFWQSRTRDCRTLTQIDTHTHTSLVVLETQRKAVTCVCLFLTHRCPPIYSHPPLCFQPCSTTFVPLLHLSLFGEIDWCEIRQLTGCSWLCLANNMWA